MNSDTGRNVIACEMVVYEMVETSIFIGDILLWCVNEEKKLTNDGERERERVWPRWCVRKIAGTFRKHNCRYYRYPVGAIAPGVEFYGFIRHHPPVRS